MPQAALIRQKREERRKARMVQVREQERAFAKRVREDVREKREEERRLLEDHLQVETKHQFARDSTPLHFSAD